MSAVVLGLDPGLAHFGWAACDMDGDDVRVLGMGCLLTVPSKLKRGVLAADDNVRRARELYQDLQGVMARHQPAVICAEAMSHPRHASSAGKLSMAWGVAAACIQFRGLPLCMESPQGLKKALTGNRSASKVDVQEALVNRWPGLIAVLAGMPKAHHEHACDALAATVACANAEVMRMARSRRAA